MNTLLDVSFAQLQVELEGLGQGPTMLECVVAAGAHDGAEVVMGREGGQGGADVLEFLRGGADDAGAAWAEQPLVGASDEEVAIQVGESDIFHAEAVYAIDAEQDAVLLVPVAVLLAYPLANFADRQFDPAAGVNPGQTNDPSVGRTWRCRLPSISSSDAWRGFSNRAMRLTGVPSLWVRNCNAA